MARRSAGRNCFDKRMKKGYGHERMQVRTVSTAGDGAEKQEEQGMQTAEELKSLLDRIDHRGYPAYKETKGIYDFGEYILSIDHVPVSYTHLPHL